MPEPLAGAAWRPIRPARWRVRLQNDVLELVRVGEPAHHAHRHLVACFGSDGGMPSCPAGTSTFCSASALVTSSGVSPRAASLVGIEPDAHRIFALAEDDDVAHARHALQRVRDIHVQVVRDEGRRERVVGRDKSAGQHEVGVRLGDRDAGVVHRRRQPSLRGGHAVLHVDRGDVEIVAGLEGDGDGRGAVVRRGRRHVAHALDAVDRLLEDDGHRRLDVLRVRANVVAADHHLRRRQLRIQRDRNRRQRHRAGQHNQQRANRGEDGTADEKLNQETLPFVSRRVTCDWPGIHRLRQRHGFQRSLACRVRGRRRRQRHHRDALLQELDAGEDHPIARSSARPAPDKHCRPARPA